MSHRADQLEVVRDVTAPVSICQQCGNTGFKASPTCRRAVSIYGSSDKHDTCDFRRYRCNQCGHKWVTMEKFYRPLLLTVNVKDPVADRLKEIRSALA